MSDDRNRQQRTILNFQLKHGEDAVNRLLAGANQGQTLTELAKVFGTSQQRLSILFKDMIGVSYYDFLTNNGIRPNGPRQLEGIPNESDQRKTKPL